MTPSPLTELCDRYLAAWDTHDVDAIMALHAADTTFWLHHGQEPATGRDEVRAAFTALFDLFPDMGFVSHRTVFGPRHWVLDWTMTSAAGRWHCLDLVTVTNDWRVSRKDTFLDGAQFDQAVRRPA